MPNELIVRKGERGDAESIFIASGAVDVIFPDRRIPLGSGDFFGEMALITGEPRQADVRAQTLSPATRAAQIRFRSLHARTIATCASRSREVAIKASFGEQAGSGGRDLGRRYQARQGAVTTSRMKGAKSWKLDSGQAAVTACRVRNASRRIRSLLRDMRWR